MKLSTACSLYGLNIDLVWCHGSIFRLARWPVHLLLFGLLNETVRFGRAAELPVLSRYHSGGRWRGGNRQNNIQYHCLAEWYARTVKHSNNQPTSHESRDESLKLIDDIRWQKMVRKWWKAYSPKMPAAQRTNDMRTMQCEHWYAARMSFISSHLIKVKRKDPLWYLIFKQEEY